MRWKVAYCRHGEEEIARMTAPDTNEFLRQLDQDPDLLEEVRPAS